MSGLNNPIDYPQDWDTVTISGNVSPGICEVSGFERAHEWDVKKGKGTQGATITYVGRPPAKGTVKFYLWTAKHFDQWDTFVPLFKYDPTKQSVQAFSMYYPSLDDIDLFQFVCEGIGAIVHEGKQLYSCTVKLLEFFPAPKASAVSTPVKATTNKAPEDPKAVVPDVIQADLSNVTTLFATASGT